MKIKINYGKSSLKFNLPNNLNIDVLEPKYIPGLPEPTIALREALSDPVASRPLKDIVKPSNHIYIVFNDITSNTLWVWGFCLYASRRTVTIPCIRSSR